MGRRMMAKYEHWKYQITCYHESNWENYEKIELAWFAQDAKECYGDVCKGLNFITLCDLKDVLEKIRELKKEAARAQTILDDWQRLKEHMKKNPTIKEEWEGILMAIKLTEED